jgi:uncharacterized protein YaaW (UPF0174 family)
MEEVSIASILEGWRTEDLGNLLYLLGDEATPASPENIEHRFKWLYHSEIRAGTETGLRNTVSRLHAKLRKSEPVIVGRDDVKDIPSYNTLLSGALKYMKAVEKDATVNEQELHLSQAVIIRALQKMTPSKRVEFFSTELDFAKISEQAGIKSGDIKAPATTLAAIGAAQLSGFGIYTAATTALGFLTGAVGVTLPFAVYTGLTSTIAFLIGPAGWLGVGLWGAWKLTGPKWDKIIPGLIYMISTHAANQLRET